MRQPISQIKESNLRGLVPIGGVMPYYDYDGLEKISYDKISYVMADGTTGVLFGDGTTRDLPDFSNRYLVGFGTEGGQDIDTAAWATAAVGNASHQIDLSHIHYVAKATGTGVSTNNAMTFYRTTYGGADTMQIIQDSVDTSGGAFLTYMSSTFSAANIDIVSSSSLSATQSIQQRSVRVRMLVRRA